jgi:hypothetical protein
MARNVSFTDRPQHYIKQDRKYQCSRVKHIVRSMKEADFISSQVLFWTRNEINLTRVCPVPVNLASIAKVMEGIIYAGTTERLNINLPLNYIQGAQVYTHWTKGAEQWPPALLRHCAITINILLNKIIQTT